MRGLGLLLALVLAAAVAGCTRVVAGTAAVAPPHAFPITAAAPPPAGPVPPAAGAVRPGGPSPGGSAATVAPATLEPDVVADECLLDGAELTALLGRPVGPPRQSVTTRDDGSRSSSCYAAPGDPGAPDPGPAAAINVYRVRTGTPAAFVRAAATGGRAFPGVGEAAAVLGAADGGTLQVAGRRYLVTVAVQGARPDDAAWRAAGTAALTRLAARLANR